MPGKKGLILVVEDEIGLQKIVGRRAEREGLDVLFAGTNEEGFALATASSPDCILLDLHLPDGPGIGLLARLKADERTSHIHVIVWSGSDVVEGDQDALRAGAIAYFEKTDARCVVAKIVELLDGAQATPQ
jgi:CheY-like chemotaxis protein